MTHPLPVCACWPWSPGVVKGRLERDAPRWYCRHCGMRLENEEEGVDATNQG